MFQVVTAALVVGALLAGAPLAARLPLTTLVAAAGVVGLGALQGLLVAVALAVGELGRRAARPHDAALAFAGPDQPAREVDERDGPHLDVLIYRLDAPLFFANTDRIRERVLTLAAERDPELRCVILDAEAFFHLDATTAAALARLAVDLRARGCQLAVARARPAILATLRANPYEAGATKHLPTFPTVRDAFIATRRPPG